MIKLINYFLLFLFLSCSKQSNKLVLFDKFYYLNNSEISNNGKWDYIVFDLLNDSTDELNKYDDIFISPLMYNSKIDYFTHFNNRLHVLELGYKLESDLKTSVYINNNNSYIQLIEIIKKSVEFNKITVIINSDSKYSKEDIVNLNKGLEFNNLVSLQVSNKTNKANISDFILENRDTDLWIINSGLYDLYIYERITNGKIVIADGVGLNKINSNVIYSFEVEVVSEISNYFDGDVDFIYSYLKSY